MEKISIESSGNFSKSMFLHIQIEESLSLLAVKFHAHSFFLLRDTDDNIRPCKISHAWETINLQIG